MSKTSYFYYDYLGEKKGAFSGKDIKALAKDGNILPDTVIETADGKQFLARGIAGIEFWNGDKTEVPAAVPINMADSDDGGWAVQVLTQDQPKENVRVPLPEPKPETWDQSASQDEMSNRLLILCLVSIPIPGLGHYLLGCDKSKCFWLGVSYIVSMIFWVLLFSIAVFLCFFLFAAFFFVDVVKPFQTVYGFLVTVFVFPLAVPFAFWRTYHWLIQDLKKEYARRTNKQQPFD
jgi:hypothetical protein